MHCDQLRSIRSACTSIFPHMVRTMSCTLQINPAYHSDYNSYCQFKNAAFAHTAYLFNFIIGIRNDYFSKRYSLGGYYGETKCYLWGRNWLISIIQMNLILWTVNKSSQSKGTGNHVTLHWRHKGGTNILLPMVNVCAVWDWASMSGPCCFISGKQLRFPFCRMWLVSNSSWTSVENLA